MPSTLASPEGCGARSAVCHPRCVQGARACEWDCGGGSPALPTPLQARFRNLRSLPHPIFGSAELRQRPEKGQSVREAWKAAGDKQLDLPLGLLTVRDGTGLVPPFLRCPCTCSRYCAAFGALTWPSEPCHHLLCTGFRAPPLVSRGFEGAEKQSQVLPFPWTALPRPCCAQGLPHLTSFPWGLVEKLARFYFVSQLGSVQAKPLPGEVVSKGGCNGEAKWC